MAILEGSTLTPAQALAMNTSLGGSQGRDTLRTRKHSHQAPGAAPSPSYGAGNQFQVAPQNRAFTTAIMQRWRTTITTLQKTAWAATAAANTVKLNNGTTKTLTGMQLYFWLLRNNVDQFYIPGELFNLAQLTNFDDPPSPWTVPTVPYDLTFDGFFRMALVLDWTVAELFATPSPTALTTPFSTHQVQTHSGPLVRLGTGAFLLDQNTHRWRQVIYASGVFPNENYLQFATLILRRRELLINPIPSDPFTFTVPARY